VHADFRGRKRNFVKAISRAFIENAVLRSPGGAGKYSGASGTVTLGGRAHNLCDPSVSTFNVVYRGSVGGPNMKDGTD
jgi:hypothetical protein